MEFSVRISGLEEIVALLKELPRATEARVVNTALRLGGGVLRSAIRSRAPVGPREREALRYYISRRSGKKAARRYGKLKENIRVTKVGQGRYAVHVGKAFWGMFLEFGTRRMAARPFMRPAFDSSKGEVLARVGREMGIGVEREAVRLAGGRGRFRQTVFS